jgi:hypothetical protein
MSFLPDPSTTIYQVKSRRLGSILFCPVLQTFQVRRELIVPGFLGYTMLVVYKLFRAAVAAGAPR